MSPTPTTKENNMTNQSMRTDTMNVEDIGRYVAREGISAKRFWWLAMGGDVQPLPSSVVQDLIAEHERALRE